MNVYAARNDGSIGSAVEIQMGGFHSAGIVIVAESLEDAQTMLRTHLLVSESPWKRHERERARTDFDFDARKEVDGLEQVNMSQPSIVMYAEGDC